MVAANKVHNCKWCGVELNGAAQYCSNCRTFSGWRGWFGAAERTIGLLITLVSVLGLIASHFAGFFFPDRARIFASIKQINESSVEVQLTNTGRVSAFSYGFFACHDWPDWNPETALYLTYSTPLAVPSGATVTEEFILTVGSNKSQPLSKDAALARFWPQSALPANESGSTLLCQGSAFDEVGILEIFLNEPFVDLEWRNGLSLSFFMMQPD